MTDGETTLLDEAMLGLTDWPEKLNVCVRILLEHIHQSAQYIRGVITTLLARFLRVLNYRFTPRRLRSQLVFLRAAIGQQQLSPSCLQQWSLQPVVEYQSIASLALIHEDLRCAAIINRHLPPEILESINHYNLCESYKPIMDE